MQMKQLIESGMKGQNGERKTPRRRGGLIAAKGLLNKSSFRDSAYGAEKGGRGRDRSRPVPTDAIRLCSSFRRKPESIFAFAFSLPRSDGFTPGRGGSESNIKTKGEFSGFRIQTPRDNKVVAAPPGKKSKWIPAQGRNDGASPHRSGLEPE